MMKTWALELEKHPNLRLNTIVPGGLQSPQRKKTHPGEVHNNLATTESVMPTYLYLMGSDAKGISGKVFNC